ncbi:dTMP kinase [Candidatus Micrarchaeota archaeon CG11_big_fil_rev_8_21_14_0_20_47_5]|nr:MAG: dTMP kinase [Candidatus Micrarchaeota archaeon CG1_02_47_40]PIN83452.1 MAG: dTMP kinase [Candidatus Micrarchaeota archaeon CG11_big_fil_rev_8_21_14_0_20_47_5]
MPLVVFEGIDGCGKKTQILKLTRLLNSHNFSFSLYKYPARKTPLLHSHLSGKISLDSRTLFFLFSLDILAEQENIRADLAKGKTVILDRYILSTIAYSSSNPSFADAKKIALSLNFIPPDKIFLLDVPPAISQKRKALQKKLDTYEANLPLLSATRKNYLSLCKERFLCKNWVRIDAGRKKEEVFKEIAKHFK